MSLTPRELRSLAEIEMQFRQSDSQLVAMFTLWTAGRARWGLPLGGVRGDRAGSGERARVLVVVVLISLTIGLAIFGVLTTSPVRPAPRPSMTAVHGGRAPVRW